MAIFSENDVNPNTLKDLIETVFRDGDEIYLAPGEYKGPYIIDKEITIRGLGENTEFFAENEPVFTILAKNVRLENLVINRTVGGETGAVAIQAEQNIKPVLKDVKLNGKAENVKWENARWNIPSQFDFGEMQSNWQISKSFSLEVAEPCQITCKVSWLQIKPSHVSPGPQEIKIEVNTENTIPGTVLSTPIELRSDNEKREIFLIVKISHSPVDNLIITDKRIETHLPLNRIESQDWGYKLKGKAIDQLISIIEGRDTLSLDLDFQERRNQAENILFETFAQQYSLFYIRRLKSGQNQGEEIWDLTLATDRTDIELPIFFREHNQTLGIRAVVFKDNNNFLEILSFILLPKYRGQLDGFATPFCLRFLSTYRHRIGIPQSAVTKIQSIPIIEEKLPTDTQINTWKKYLELEENIAQNGQFCIRYINHNYGQATRNITFHVDINDATIDSSRKTYLEEEELWIRIKNARNQRIAIIEDISSQNNNTIEVGVLENFNHKDKNIKIKLENEFSEKLSEGYYQLPKVGFLYFEAVGDIVQIQRKQRALEQLQRGNCQNPFLSDFLFDASQAREPEAIIELSQEELLLKNSNPAQKKAVEIALATPDLALIQGPPGTGKTTVIAEICYQVARRGGKTLISSQANLAVDNALSRLKHNPIIRAVRKGNPHSVGVEGQPFLEDKVINRWLENTANDCEKNLKQKQLNISIFRELLNSSERFTNYRKLENNFSSEQKQLFSDKQKYDKYQSNLLQEHEKLKQLINHLQSLEQKISNLLTEQNNIDWQEQDTINLLIDIEEYLDRKEIAQLQVHISRAIDLLEEMKIFHFPVNSLLITAGYLKQNLPNYFSNMVNIFTKMKVIIDNCLVEVENAKNVDYFELYNLIKTHLENRQAVEQFNLIAPVELLNVAPTIEKILWHNILKESEVQTKKVLPHYINWDRTQTLNNEIQKNLILSEKNITPIDNKIFNLIHQEVLPSLEQQIILDKLDPLALLEHFEQLSKNSYKNIKDKLNLFKKIQEIVKAVCVKFNLSNPSQRSISIATLKIIQQKLDSLVEELRPQEIKKSGEMIKNEATKTSISTANKWLKRLTQEIDFWLLKLAISSSKNNSNFLQNIQLLFQEVNQSYQIPETLKSIARDYQINPIKTINNAQKVLEEFRYWGDRTAKLKELISLVHPIYILENAHAQIKQELHQHQIKENNILQQKSIIKANINNIEIQLKEQQETLANERNWWLQTWEAIPERLKSEIPQAQLFGTSFLQEIQIQFVSWRKELIREQDYLNRYENLVQDWINKLRQPTEQDRRELQQIYLDNANVVGITCVQAAKSSFSKEFQYFDVVIIDEVSKCTPPELLIPALKARKLILVGDHRQLPPMLDNATLEEIAEQLGSTKEEINFLEESLFKLQFEQASSNIKNMLKTQYRMHPQIMGAINQFYDGKLDCGIFNPDLEKAHNLSGDIIKDQNHIIWVQTPQFSEFFEEKMGNSFINKKEVKVIQKICEMLETSWVEMFSLKKLKKEVGIITFYGSQLKLIDNEIDPRQYPSLEIRTGTVDRFQGMEKEIIIVSLVRNNNKNNIGFAKKPERINVAFSRSQQLLIIVGCYSLFTQQRGKVGQIYSNISEVIRLHGGLINVFDILR